MVGFRWRSRRRLPFCSNGKESLIITSPDTLKPRDTAKELGSCWNSLSRRDPSETSNLSGKWSLQTKISNDFLTPKYSNKSKGKISFEDPRFLHRTATLPDRTDHVLSAGGEAEGGGANFGSKTFRNRTGANGCNLQKAFVSSTGRSSSGCQINHKTSREIWRSHKQ